MAKNRKQDRSQQRTSAAERSSQAKGSATGATPEQRASQIAPGESARKSKQKRFGHN
ncbi:hypothetical protein AB0K09_20465 [Streptomyces sp. NPDC049577]|uniref:hypothetical protein n=1 Tax=Streptomyces sp. NPDC049577 TaxID=3155153 RepID=UPI00342F08F6